MKVTLVLALATAGITLTALVSEIASADDFAQRHPRRAQVNRRDRREKNKNNAAAADGQITDQQARRLDRQDNRIRRQQRAEAAANGGHITKGEQAQLNREENRVNRERRADERNDAAAAPTPAPAPAPTN